MDAAPRQIRTRTTGRSPEEVLGIDDYEKAIQAIVTYGDHPSMLYNMDKATRGEYAQALIDSCKEVGLREENIPPLWRGIVDDPNLHEELAQRYLTR